MSGIGASTRVFALLGDPVGHSLSARMWNPTFRTAGIDGVYVALRCGPDEVGGLLRGLALAGGGGNVTLPHKARALEVADEAHEAARRTGVANTFWSEDGRVVVDNTDVAGVGASLELLRPAGIRGADVLLLGAGGAARAALVALLDAGVGRVAIHNRTPERARALADDLADPRVRVTEAVDPPWADLVVQATSLGIRPGDPLPLDPTTLERGTAVLDLVYGSDPVGTPFVRAAREAGLDAMDGREMLLGQGVASFRRWFGRDPSLETMRAAIGEVP